MRTTLSRQERAVCVLMLLGYSTKLIARVMLIGPRTVDSYRGNVLRKLNVGSTKELAYKLYDMEDKSHVSKA